MSDSMRIERVVVTGSAGALGQEVASFLQAQGRQVVGLDLGYEHTQLQQEASGLWTCRLDATKAGEVTAVLAKVRQELGELDALVHCTGGFRWAHFEALGPEDIDFLIDVNLRSAALMLHGVLGEMKRANKGRVVLVSSRATLSPGAGEGLYAGTKSALNAIVKSVAAEVASLNVTINAVLPSIIDTPANRKEMPEADFSTWVGREQLAAIIGSLLEPIGAPINGALIPVSGRT